MCRPISGRHASVTRSALACSLASRFGHEYMAHSLPLSAAPAHNVLPRHLLTMCLFLWTFAIRGYLRSKHRAAPSAAMFVVTSLNERNPDVIFWRERKTQGMLGNVVFRERKSQTALPAGCVQTVGWNALLFPLETFFVFFIHYRLYLQNESQQSYLWLQWRLL